MSVPVAHGARRAATAAAEPPELPPGTGAVSHGFLTGPIVRGLAGRAHRELVHVGLAEHDRAGRIEPLDDVRVVGRDEVRQHLRAAGREPAPRAENVLLGDRDTGERPALAAGDPRVRGAPPARGCARGSSVMKAVQRSLRHARSGRGNAASARRSSTRLAASAAAVSLSGGVDALTGASSAGRKRESSRSASVAARIARLALFDDLGHQVQIRLDLRRDRLEDLRAGRPR